MIQVYTGNGKGKTTAALGLALRAAGAGLKVYIGQFIKGKEYSELVALKKFKNIKVEQFGRGRFIREKLSRQDLESAKRGIEKIKKIIADNIYDVVILDEINIALHLKLLSPKEVLGLMKNTPRKIELVLTGRCAGQSIIKNADLVSDIKERKHYFRKGLRARRGIEY